MSGSIRGELRKLKGKMYDLKGILKGGRMQKDVRVLMFHDLSEPTDYGPGVYSVSEEDFERIISDFSETHKFVSLGEIVKFLKGEGELPEKAVAVTFDDGYRSTKEKALPVLEKFGVPATVYVPSNFLNIESMSVCQLAEFLRENQSVDFEFSGEEFSFNLRNLEDENKAYNVIKELIGDLKVSERQEFLEENRIVPEGAFLGKLIDNEDLKELDDHELISIGAHTTDHRKLTELDLREARKSIEESKKDLEAILGHEVSSFSFPFGAKNEKLLKAVEEAGFENAVVTEERRISKRDWNKICRIPRVDGKDLA